MILQFTPVYIQTNPEKPTVAGQISKREAGLMERFGFKWTQGRYIETVSYDQITRAIPEDHGVRVIYADGYPLESSLAKILLIDIPTGVLVSGDPKNLGSAWIFAYFDFIEDTHRDGRKSLR